MCFFSASDSESVAAFSALDKSCSAGQYMCNSVPLGYAELDLVAIIASAYMIEVRRKLRVWVILRALGRHGEAVRIAPSILLPQREADGAGDKFFSGADAKKFSHSSCRSTCRIESR
jgi:hypothetical protein